jgi:hypothetical protein
MRRAGATSAEAGLDKLLIIVKWIFFYIPGVLLIHPAMMGFALMFFYGDFELFALLDLIIVGAFLMMLGFGKIRDLKYLKAVLTVFGFSFILAMPYAIWRL